MARCYANENFPLPTVEVLRHVGHDVLTTADSSRAGQAMPDADVLAVAVAEQREVKSGQVALRGHPAAVPNKGLQPTGNSLRSYLAAAIPSG
jgi:hypothetical protein